MRYVIWDVGGKIFYRISQVSHRTSFYPATPNRLLITPALLHSTNIQYPASSIKDPVSCFCSQCTLWFHVFAPVLCVFPAAYLELHLLYGSVKHGNQKQCDQIDSHTSEGWNGHGNHDIGPPSGGGKNRDQR